MSTAPAGTVGYPLVLPLLLPGRAQARLPVPTGCGQCSLGSLSCAVLCWCSASHAQAELAPTAGAEQCVGLPLGQTLAVARSQSRTRVALAQSTRKRARAHAHAHTHTHTHAGVFEAEEALLSGVLVARNMAGATNGNFVRFAHVDDDYVEWTIPACAAGRCARAPVRALVRAFACICACVRARAEQR